MLFRLTFDYTVLLVSLLYSFFIESFVVATNKECGGSEVKKEALYRDDCAIACKEVSSMYSFSPSSGSSGFCYCETSVDETGKCEMKSAHGSTLYQYNSGSLTIS